MNNAISSAKNFIIEHQQPLSIAVASGIITTVDNPILNVALGCLIGAQLTDGSLSKRFTVGLGYSLLAQTINQFSVDQIFGQPNFATNAMPLHYAAVAVGLLFTLEQAKHYYYLIPIASAVLTVPGVLHFLSTCGAGYYLGCQLSEIVRVFTMGEKDVKLYHSFILAPFILGLSKSLLPKNINLTICATALTISMLYTQRQQWTELKQRQEQINRLQDNFKNEVATTETRIAGAAKREQTLNQRINQLTYVNSDLLQKNSVLRQENSALQVTQANLTAQTTMRSLPNVVSSWFDDDRILSKFTCVISGVPCVSLVLDPDRNTFYEEDQILLWLKTKKFSPSTRLPLDASLLKPMPKLNALIASRLEYLKTCKENCKNKIHDRQAVREAYEEVLQECPENAYLFDDLLSTKDHHPLTFDALDLHEVISEELKTRAPLAHLDLAAAL